MNKKKKEQRIIEELKTIKRHKIYRIKRDKMRYKLKGIRLHQLSIRWLILLFKIINSSN